MTAVSDPTISIVVATRDRVALLACLLRSLAAAQRAAAVSTETIVVDNGSTDGSQALLAEWVCGDPTRVYEVVPQRGKSRALNRALALARAPLLVFADDDVEVAPNWLQAIAEFFAAHPDYDAAMGRVLVPPHTDPRTRARVARYGTLPLFDAGPAVRDVRELYGCNMALRRRLTDTIGGFDERLGPGASGWGEDSDLSARALQAHLRLGYMPDAVVYHVVDAARLTRAFFSSYHRRKAQGDFTRDPEGMSRKNVSRLVDAALRLAWCTVSGQTQRGMQARMRVIRQCEFLRLRWRAARHGRPFETAAEETRPPQGER